MMTTPSNPEREALKPCPFCGRAVDDDLRDTLYPSGVYRRGELEYVSHRDRQEGDTPCWTMHCVAHEGGCGAEVSGDTEAEVRAAWNRRTPPTPPEGAADREAFEAAWSSLPRAWNPRGLIASNHRNKAGGYADPSMEIGWRMFNAALSQSAAASTRVGTPDLTEAAAALLAKAVHFRADLNPGHKEHFRVWPAEIEALRAALASLPKALPPQPEPLRREDGWLSYDGGLSWCHPAPHAAQPMVPTSQTMTVEIKS